MPRLFRRAADQLAGAAPGWLVETVRPAPAPLRWGPMLRTAVAVTTPLILAVAAGQVVAGLLPAMGAMTASVGDRGGSYRARTILMGAAGLAGALGYLAGALVNGHGWWTVPVLVVISVVSALISTVGATGSMAGLQLLVMAAIGAGIEVPGSPGQNALMFLLGAGWAVALAVAGWLTRPRAAEEAAVIAVYRTLSLLFSDRDPDALVAFDITLKNGYETVLGARSRAAGTDPERRRLVALLNQASLIRNALISLDHEGREPPGEAAETVEDLTEALAGGREPSRPRPCECDSPALRALCSAAREAVELVSGSEVASDQLPYEPVGHAHRLRAMWEKMWYGHLTRVYTVRLALCMGAAAAISELDLFERSYWTSLTVALVLKPDFGSVFARAVQRALGTFAGALIGTAVLLVVPYGPAILIPIAVFAALLPYGMQRNWGLMSTFQAPLVLLLVDLLTHGGPRLAEIRLLDTLIGCLIVLLLGYLPWSASWEAPVGPQFAEVLSAVAGYLRHAFDPRDGTRATHLRKAYDALADLRTVFQRAVTEPPAISGRITTWLPALVSLEQLTDASAATAARTDHGMPPPSEEAVHAVVTALEDIAADIRAGRTPSKPELPEDEALERVNSALHRLRDIVSENRSG
ncbi:FUSC family protein [Streptosporangium subroseum]|uniref:FUSC family protein n=1 Tax=Streptosporangium subroseum TaxID=106412 RepID=UPI00308EE1AA|nr:FUSC family protein [Streptosporangium subroseum]